MHYRKSSATNASTYSPDRGAHQLAVARAIVYASVGLRPRVAAARIPVSPWEARVNTPSLGRARSGAGHAARRSRPAAAVVTGAPMGDRPPELATLPTRSPAHTADSGTGAIRADAS